MMERDWSSPHGGRAISAALMAAEKGIRARQKDLREKRGEGASNEGSVADKWQLLRALTVARAAFGVSDRALAVLNALLSFHPGKSLDGTAPLIVFPSNAELSLRALGMAPATLRRHLASLIEAGLILRRDSPNGKRYRRTGVAGQGHGEGEGRSQGKGQGEGEAYGFDLSPLALLAPRIFAEQEAREAEAREAQRLRIAITITRRDAGGVIEAGLAEGRCGPFERLCAELAGLVLPRRSAHVTLADLGALLDRLVRLCAEAENAYLSSLSDEEMSASDARNERHLLNSNTEPSESNGHRQNTGATPRETADAARALKGDKGDDRAGPALEKRGFDLVTVLRVCPDIADYAAGPIRSLADLGRAADIVRSALGISASAYEDAKAVMGEGAAAVVIAAMLQRAVHIRSAGGYLRALTEKAREGRFSLGPMLRALDG